MNARHSASAPDNAASRAGLAQRAVAGPIADLRRQVADRQQLVAVIRQGEAAVEAAYAVGSAWQRLKIQLRFGAKLRAWRREIAIGEQELLHNRELIAKLEAAALILLAPSAGRVSN